MSKRVKGLSINKTRINFIGFLNRGNYLVIVILFLKESWYQSKNKGDVNLFTYDLLTKRKNICNIQYLH